jgi:ABC-type nitrate/sulfonate/bicarbonate transport system permease component
MLGTLSTVVHRYRGSALILLAFLVIWEVTAVTHQGVLRTFWEALGLAQPVPDWRFLSSPVDVVTALPGELLDGSLPLALQQTLAHCLYAFVIAWFAGLIFSQLVASSRTWERAILPIINGLSGIPPVTLFPLLLVAFKLGGGSVIALAVFGAVISVTLICYEAQSRVTAEFRLMISKLGYSRFGRWMWELSTASDGLYTAAREGLRWSLILCVVGEMHGSVAGGLGAYIDSGRLNQNYAVVYVGILACALLSLMLKVALDGTASFLHRIVKGFLLGTRRRLLSV